MADAWADGLKVCSQIATYTHHVRVTQATVGVDASTHVDVLSKFYNRDAHCEQLIIVSGGYASTVTA
jgi:hypothetical protein